VPAKDRIYCLGEEFTDFVLIDEQRQSVIVNLDIKYFKIVYKEYKKLGLVLKHVTRFKESSTMTCVFARS
jgi:hypothetical protein